MLWLASRPDTPVDELSLKGFYTPGLCIEIHTSVS